ncbi:hypothetical protein [Streptomyces sp. DSM 118878]
MEIEDRPMPVNRDDPVRIDRPAGAQGAVVWRHDGGWQQGLSLCFHLLNQPGLDDRQETWPQRIFTCASGPTPSTARRRSCPPMSHSGNSPNSVPPCAAP